VKKIRERRVNEKKYRGDGKEIGRRTSCKTWRRRIIGDPEGGSLKIYVSSYLGCSEIIIPQELTGVKGPIQFEREISAGGEGATHYIFKSHVLKTSESLP
jgi:hypothetical protein